MNWFVSGILGILILTLCCSPISAQGNDYLISIRSGYAYGALSEFASSPSLSLVIGHRVSPRVSIVLAVGYQPGAETLLNNNYACVWSSGCKHSHQKGGLTSLGAGLRYQMGDLSVSHYLPRIEVFPTLYYGQWDDLSHRAEGKDQPRIERLIPGFEANLIVPSRLSSQVSLELGMGYAYSADVDEEDGFAKEGLRHFRVFAGFGFKF